VRIGNSVQFSASAWLSFKRPWGTLESFEHYDFYINPEAENVTYPNQLSLMLWRERPRWAGEGLAVNHRVSWRVDRYEDLPASIREFIDTEAPLFQEPPEDMAEVEALQRGEPPVRPTGLLLLR
jgi:hypothetical protein